MQEKLEKVCNYDSKLIHHKKNKDSTGLSTHSSTTFWWHHGIKNESNFTENPEKSGCLEKGK